MSSLKSEVNVIDHLQFGILSNEDILGMSKVEITDKTFYDNNGDPKLNSLFDPRMGTIEKGKLCQTCYNDYIDCPGHPGHINLAHPIFNVQLVNYIKDILFCVCKRCSRVLLNPDSDGVKKILEETKGSMYQRNKKIIEYIKANKLNMRCGNPDNDLFNPNGCGAIQPTKIHNRIVTDIAMVCEWIDPELGSETFEMRANVVLALFKRITESDAAILGYNREWCLPHYLIMQTLLIVPPSCRPSVRRYNGQRSEDDITTKYNEILKQNEDLRDLLSNPEAQEKHIKDNINLLQTHINTMINNDGKSGYMESKTRAGRPIKSIIQRFTGKEGRIRHNLMGKRVDFSARSVIGPDANLKISELGVPREIAMNLTFPEIVNKFNRERLLIAVRNGNEVYPGAMSIVKGDTGEMFNIGYMNVDNINLEYGDTVNRHLIDGDFVLFNRQPSLHRMSMMGHRIRVMEGKTFRLNVDVCTPYNADFDFQPIM